MSYIDRNLLPDEKIVFRTKKHLIIFFYPLVLLIISYYATGYMLNQPLLNKLIFAPWLVTGIFWAHTGLEYLFSDFAVTTHRVMMREGFFFRHANEMRVTTISQVNIDQGPVAQILNYGTVVIQAFGAFDAYTLIAKPIEFQREAQMQMGR